MASCNEQALCMPAIIMERNPQFRFMKGEVSMVSILIAIRRHTLSGIEYLQFIKKLSSMSNVVVMESCNGQGICTMTVIREGNPQFRFMKGKGYPSLLLEGILFSAWKISTSSKAGYLQLCNKEEYLIEAMYSISRRSYQIPDLPQNIKSCHQNAKSCLQGLGLFLLCRNTLTSAMLVIWMRST